MKYRTSSLRTASIFIALLSTAGCSGILSDGSDDPNDLDKKKEAVDPNVVFGTEQLDQGLELRAFDGDEQVGVTARVGGLSGDAIEEGLQATQAPTIDRYQLDGYVALRQGGTYKLTLQDRAKSVAVYLDTDDDGQPERYSGGKVQLSAGAHVIRVDIPGDSAPAWKKQEIKRLTPKAKFKPVPDAAFAMDPLPGGTDDAGTDLPCDVTCDAGQVLAEDCQPTMLVDDAEQCEDTRADCCLPEDVGFTCDIACGAQTMLSASCQPTMTTGDAAECETLREDCCVEQDTGFTCDIACSADLQLSDTCESTMVTSDEVECQSLRSDCCIEQDSGFTCNISCDPGTVLSAACEASVLTEDEAACDAERDACCVPEQSQGCDTVCGPGQRLLADSTIRGESCRDHVQRLQSTDVACTEPGIDVVYACCENIMPPPPPPASSPCLDFCPDGSQMVGSRLVPDGSATCWDHALSLPSDAPLCLAPDTDVVDTCCGTPQPDPGNRFGFCCLCGNCDIPPEERRELTVGPEGKTCMDIDFEVISSETKGSPMCDAKTAAFRPTCCDPDFEPPPPVGGQSIEVPPCEGPKPPAYCGGNEPTCNLCRDGSYPDKPFTITAIAYISGNPTCHDLYWMGREGALPAALCYPIQNFMEEPCGCN